MEMSENLSPLILMKWSKTQFVQNHYHKTENTEVSNQACDRLQQPHIFFLNLIYQTNLTQIENRTGFLHLLLDEA